MQKYVKKMKKRNFYLSVDNFFCVNYILTKKNIMLKDRIAKIEEYFHGMEITNGVCIVRVHYKEKWGVFPSDDGRIKVAPSDEIANVYFYYGDYEDVSFDEIFDLVESTITANLDAAAKFSLYQEKAEELKHLFSHSTLDDLKRMYFAFEPIKKTRKTKSKKKSENNEPILEEIVEIKESIE